ncbi:MAG: hypothetical protein ACK5BV_10115, partial [Bacteroidota bacterium]
MPNRSDDTVFLLIKSLEKSEKRNFKLYAARNTGGTDLKVIQLFDALDKMKIYDEVDLLKKNKRISKAQLSNLKAHLQKLILSSLRLIRQSDNISLQLNEQMDFARILYNKGFYLQSLKTLEKCKEQALAYQQYTYLQQIIFFEKKIEALYITRSMQHKADELRLQSIEVNEKLLAISKLSGLSLQLYGWYIKNGVARNKRDEAEVKAFLEKELPADGGRQKGFYEELYYYQSMNWYAFIRQDFLQHYRYSKKWVEVFDRYPEMIEVETAHYIKGLHNLMASYFDMQKAEDLAATIEIFEKFSRRKT